MYTRGITRPAIPIALCAYCLGLWIICIPISQEVAHSAIWRKATSRGASCTYRPLVDDMTPGTPRTAKMTRAFEKPPSLNSRLYASLSRLEASSLSASKRSFSASRASARISFSARYFTLSRLSSSLSRSKAATEKFVRQNEHSHTSSALSLPKTRPITSRYYATSASVILLWSILSILSTTEGYWDIHFA